MTALQDHHDPEWLQVLMHRLGDLVGEAFLHLQTARYHFDPAGNFRQDDNLPIVNVADVGEAEERSEVMFAIVSGHSIGEEGVRIWNSHAPYIFALGESLDANHHMITIGSYSEGFRIFSQIVPVGFY